MQVVEGKIVDIFRLKRSLSHGQSGLLQVTHPSGTPEGRHGSGACRCWFSPGCAAYQAKRVLIRDGTLLRLWEQAGRTSTCAIQLPAGMNARTAQFCNLRGELTGPSIPIPESGSFTVTTRAMAPTSVILLGPSEGK